MVTDLSRKGVLDKIEAETGCACEIVSNITNDETIRIPVEQLHAAIEVLRENFGVSHLSTITAQQRESQPGAIELIYHFWHGKGISLLIQLPFDVPEVPSIITLIPGADFYEREVAEMYGVAFTGRSETPPLLLPDGWDQGPPFIVSKERDE